MPAAQGNVGPVFVADGGTPVGGTRQGRLGDIIVSELHGRFYEQAFRGNLFSAGLATAFNISAAVSSIATLGPTAVPILGVFNPPTSKVNLVMLQASLNIVITALQCTGTGGLFWAVASGLTAPISTSTVPWNRLTLQQTVGQGRNVSGLALTGLSSNLVVAFGSALASGPNYGIAFLATAAGPLPAAEQSIENFDGSIIIPPGGLLALLAGVTPIALSATGALLWEEVSTI